MTVSNCIKAYIHGRHHVCTTIPTQWPCDYSGCIFHMHTVGSPEIVVEVGHGGGGHPLVAGDSLTLTCNVTVTQEGMSDGVTMSVGWFKGEENEEIKSASVIDVHDKEIGSYTFEHSFEALSTEDSNTYKCEANLWFHTIGLLATASHSVGITVQGKAICLVLQTILLL